MNNPVETFTFDEGVVELYHDEDYAGPRENDNIVTFALYHRRYGLGDKKEYDEASDLTEWLEENKATVEVMAIYGYEHGGITISCAPFSCPWDSGQLGVAYITKGKALSYGAKRKTWREEARHWIECETSEYNTYLTEGGYGWVAKDEHGEVIESCWGYNGYEDGKLAATDEGGSALRYHARKMAVEANLQSLKGASQNGAD